MSLQGSSGGPVVPPDSENPLVLARGPAKAERNGLDDLVALAAATMDMPIATLTLFNGRRNRLAAHCGLDDPPSTHGAAFARVLVGQTPLLVVTDALADARFAKDPLLTCGVRFQASIALVANDGRLLGALGVADRRVRAAPEQERLDALTRLASIAIHLLDQRDAEDRLHLRQRDLLQDPLTGLPNRDGLLALLESMQVQSLPIGIALLGLDNFRAINDTLGHAIGDTVLQIVAARLQAWLPADAWLARVGGDEFALVFPVSAIDVLETQLHNLLRTLARSCDIDYQRVHIEACIGLAVDDGRTTGLPHADAGELLARAGLAMQRAKRAGNRHVRRFSPDMRTEAITRRRLDLDLRRAHHQGEFVLHYQPQLDLTTGLPTGAEALLRWQHPEHGLLLPGAFIEALAQSAVAPSVGRWILQRACADAAMWPVVQGRRLQVGVNLFPVQFDDHGLVEEVEQALQLSGLPAGQLELELTETIALREDSVAEQTLAMLRARGTRVSYDDFGTGHASLSMLHRLPVDRVKIDRSFVRDVLSNRGDEAIVRSIALIARNFDMAVIAEGVETEGQALRLQELGCQEVQGFLYSKALPLEDFVRWLTDLSAARDAAARITLTP